MCTRHGREMFKQVTYTIKRSKQDYAFLFTLGLTAYLYQLNFYA